MFVCQSVRENKKTAASPFLIRSLPECIEYVFELVRYGESLGILSLQWLI